MTEAVLRATGLRKRFGDILAVDGATFEVRPGESYGLLGPNGAGKTTTISMICGLLTRDEGEVTIAGRNLDESHEVKRAVGYVPQEVALYPDLTGRENLKFFGRMYSLKGEDLNERVERALELVGLVDRGSDRVAKYSGGMSRRLNIAAGLLHRPALLILDEPTVGVDPQSRHAILENVESLKDQGLAVLYTTHYMEEAERLCDRVGIIDSGRIIAEGTRRELIEKIGGTDRVEVAAAGDLARLAEECRKIEGVEGADTIEGGVEIICRAGRRLLTEIVAAGERAGASIQSVDVREPDLEAVFLHLTGKALRD